MASPGELPETIKLALAPAVAGIVGVFSVLFTQAIQRKNDRRRRREDQARELLRYRADAAGDLLARLAEAETLAFFCVGNRLITNDLLANIESLAQARKTDDKQDLLFASLVRNVDEKNSHGRELFADLNRVCAAAMAAAEKVGKLPEGLAVDGGTDLVATVNRWRYANLSEADRPNRREEVKELARRLQKEIATSTRAFRDRLLSELASL